MQRSTKTGIGCSNTNCATHHADDAIEPEFAHFDRHEMALVQEISERARGLFARFLPQPPSVLEIQMDLAAVHARCPLDLAALAAFDNVNFTHDIGGIYKHLNRETGDLEDCFRPRCAIRHTRR